MIAIEHPNPANDHPFSTGLSRAPRPGNLIIVQEPISYRNAWTIQRSLHEQCVLGTEMDTLLLLQHLPVYTVGRRTQAIHLGGDEAALRETGATIEPVNRGGSVTYHGPGQLVGYPILRLSQYTSGPKNYVRLLEEVLINTLALSGITGLRIADKPGVWVRSQHSIAKVASIGVRVERGVTLHGFALNVDLNLSPFAHITPCGLEGCVTTSVAEIMQTSISLPLITRHIADVFSSVFHVEWKAFSRPINGNKGVMRQEG